MIQLSDLTHAYLFIHTSNENVIRKIKPLTNGLNFEQFGKELNENCFSGVFYKNKLQAENNTFFCIEKVNDLGDYNLNSFNFSKTNPLDIQFDSLLSYCFFKDNCFVAGTDYLSIFNHFYYHDQGTFICSNNMFVVANLCGDSLSENAMYDTLFFRFPYKADTYFNAVKSLKPYQQLMFSEENGLDFSSSVSYDDLLINEPGKIKDNIDHFFSQMKNPDKLEPLVTLSGGSDSTLILSILHQKGFDCKLASHKGHTETDTIKIRKLAKKTGYPYTFIDVDKHNNFHHDDIQFGFLANGFSPSIQIYYFYKDLPGTFQIFDGYSMMLGDWSDAFMYYPYRDVIKGEPIDAVIKKYYSGLNIGFLKRMKDYLMSNYQDQFVDANTPEGLQLIRQYAVRFIPGKIISRIYKCSTNFGHLNFSFYLSRKFISYIQQNQYGIASTCSARRDYPGYMINRLPLGMIAHEVNNKICKLNLSQGVSLNDMYKNDISVALKKKIHVLNFKLFDERKNIKVPRVKKISYDLSKFDFIEQGAKLSSFAIRPLSQYNSIYSVMESYGK